jgi:hypothetical protein
MEIPPSGWTGSSELLLKACTALEVFQIEHLEPYQPEWNVYDSTDESDTDECDLELGDGRSDDEVM